MSTAARDPRNDPASRAVLTGLIGPGGGRRAFVDATGAPVVPPPVIRRVVATDERVGELLRELGVPVVACGGSAADIASLRPDLIVSDAVDVAHDLPGHGGVEALRQVAPVVAVDLARRSAATADLRALLGPAVGGGWPATEPVSDRRVGSP